MCVQRSLRSFPVAIRQAVPILCTIDIFKGTRLLIRQKSDPGSLQRSSVTWRCVAIATRDLGATRCIGPPVKSFSKPAIASRDSCSCSAGTHSRLFRLNQGHVYEIFAQEPSLQLIGTEHFAHDQVVRAIVAELSCATRQDPNLAHDDLMSVNQT